MWVRGLKRVLLLATTPKAVAPYVGAWIETIPFCQKSEKPKVAPYVGAWIETTRKGMARFGRSSHPMWVRGLKRYVQPLMCRMMMVAPYVGAWIETTRCLKLNQSHLGRTLCGCVD